MACYLITYDLNKETSRPPIVDKIREFEAWARLSESSYAVSTDMSAQDVYELMKPMLDDNDNLYVMALKKPLAGQGDQKVNDWLSNTLTW